MKGKNYFFDFFLGLAAAFLGFAAAFFVAIFEHLPEMHINIISIGL
jgi:hypothetical protein